MPFSSPSSSIKVLHVATEAAPLIKLGGLGDVLESLPKALRHLGADCRLLLPAYAGTLEHARDLGLNLRGIPKKVHVALDWRVYSGKFWKTEINAVPLYLLEQPELFGTNHVYPQEMTPEVALPFIFLCMAALELPETLRWKPQIFHVHDWPTAFIPIALKWHRHYQKKAEEFDTVLTIHNLAHQGILPQSVLDSWGIPKSAFVIDGLEFYGHVNLLKGGILSSDAITTVSPRYSWEIQTHALGMGLEGVLSSVRGKLFGILNGIDYDIWNPAKDPLLPTHYDADHLEGKSACRRALLELCRWEEDGRPILIWVGRLVEQKGMALLLSAFDRLLATSCRLVIVGCGQPLFEKAVNDYAAKHPQFLWAHTEFDEKVAHLAYAGGDILLMPSFFEPCGLSQLISMAYGTIPVARATGGLADTIIDADGSPDGNGFLFSDYEEEEFIKAILRCLKAYQDKARWRRLIVRCMKLDFSWKTSAKAYLDLYERLVKTGL